MHTFKCQKTIISYTFLFVLEIVESLQCVLKRLPSPICDALHDLVTFVQFKKREKHPWRSVNFSKLTLLHVCFSRFLNCTNVTKSRNAPHIISL